MVGFIRGFCRPLGSTRAAVGTTHLWRGDVAAFCLDSTLDCQCWHGGVAAVRDVFAVDRGRRVGRACPPTNDIRYGARFFFGCQQYPFIGGSFLVGEESRCSQVHSICWYRGNPIRSLGDFDFSGRGVHRTTCQMIFHMCIPK